MIDTIGIPEALQSLRPLAEWVLLNNTDLDWHDKKQTEPTKAEIDAEVIRLKAEYDAQEYARNRQTEYPTIEECVHAILDNDNNELDTLQAKRAEIKLKYPKGG